VPVSCVAGASAIATARLRARVALLGAAVSLTTALIGAIRVTSRPPHRADLAVADYVRDHAQRGDTQYVMYARADVEYYIGLPSPYPYAWSLMIRTVPGARAAAAAAGLIRAPYVAGPVAGRRPLAA
jgi:hypothetical protein